MSRLFVLLFDVSSADSRPSYGLARTRPCHEKLIRPRSNINIYAKNNTYTGHVETEYPLSVSPRRGRPFPVVNRIIRLRAPETETNPFDFSRRSRRKSRVSISEIRVQKDEKSFGEASLVSGNVTERWRRVRRRIKKKKPYPVDAAIDLDG